MSSIEKAMVTTPEGLDLWHQNSFLEGLVLVEQWNMAI